MSLLMKLADDVEKRNRDKAALEMMKELEKEKKASYKWSDGRNQVTSTSEDKLKKIKHHIKTWEG